MSKQGIIKTAFDAKLCKESTNGLCRKQQTPLLDRFYYLRSNIIFNLIEYYIKQLVIDNKQLQLVILGAGLDFYYHSLMLLHKITIYEVDLPEIIDIKSKHHNENVIYISNDLNSFTDVFRKLHQNGFNSNHVTIWLDECVSCYLTSESNEILLTSISKLSRNSIYISFHPMISIKNDNNGYGRMLLTKFRERGAPILNNYNDHNDIYQFYSKSNWKYITSIDINSAISLLLPLDEQIPKKKISLFDEYSSLALLLHNYAIITSTNNCYYYTLTDNLINKISIHRKENLTVWKKDISDRLKNLELVYNCKVNDGIFEAKSSHINSILNIFKQNYDSLMMKYPSVHKYIKNACKVLKSLISSENPLKEWKCFVYLNKNDVVGFITITKHKMLLSAEIKYLNVSEQNQRLNIATKLFKKAKDICYQWKVNKIELSTVTELITAKLFYKKHGFQFESTMQLSDGCCIDHMVLNLQLNSPEVCIHNT